MKIKIGQVKILFKKVSRLLAEKAFLSFLLIILLELIWGGFLFYKYSILAEKTEVEIIEDSVQFEKGVYQEVLGRWITQQIKFNITKTKEYPDAFRAR